MDPDQLSREQSDLGPYCLAGGNTMSVLSHLPFFTLLLEGDVRAATWHL